MSGQYGGAITYIADHVSDERRGYCTGWLQTSPTLGIVLSVIVSSRAHLFFGGDLRTYRFTVISDVMGDSRTLASRLLSKWGKRHGWA